MTYRDAVMRMNIPLTPEQDAACRYLESRGMKYAEDFNLINAERQALLLLSLESVKGKPS